MSFHHFRALILFPLALILASPAFAEKHVALGQEVFENNCLGCHQAGDNGHAGMAPLLTNADFLSIASDTFLFKTINEGRMNSGMPPWATLGDKKINAVIAYLRSQSSTENRSAAVNRAPTAKGDSHRGSKLFEQICLTCHGIKGQGYENGNTGTHIGDAAFLRVASDGYIREVIKQGRSGTAMRAFTGPKAIAALKDQEIDDIIIYLRSLSTKAQGDAS
ncbi:MAG: c-type cytochrome [Mariprofundus sp.]|nr:c-type cytochrome [Mariprofundus sp.]